MKIVQVTHWKYPNTLIDVGDGTKTMRVKAWLEQECIRRKKHGENVWVSNPNKFGRIAIFRKE